MSEKTTNPNGSSKNELKQVKETPEQINKRISEAGYGSIEIGRVVATHAIQFEVSEDREKAGNNKETSEFMRAGNQVDKKFIPEEQALGQSGPLKQGKKKAKKLSRDEEDKDQAEQAGQEEQENANSLEDK